MAYLLVSWDSDESISIINRKSKSLVSLEGDRVQFRWPRLGLYDGTIVESSGSFVWLNYFNTRTIYTDSKKEMEEEAKRMAHENHSQGGDKDESENC